MKEYLSNLPIPIEQKQYAMSFYNKIIHLDKLHSIATNITHSYVCTGYGNVKRGNDTYTTKPDLSASAYATNKEQYDVSKNIYDLAGNVRECTLKTAEDDRRTYRGGFFDADISASFGWRYSSIKCFSRNRF